MRFFRVSNAVSLEGPMYNGPGSNVSDAAPYSPLSTASAAELSLRPSGCYPISDAPSSNIPIMWLDDEVREDDPTVLLMSLEGFAVDVANTAAKGLALASRHDYCAIIVDLRLPDIDGLTVLQRLAALRISAPVLLFSGFLDVDVVAAAARLGVRDFRSKPLFAADLIDAVRALVQGRAAAGATVRIDRCGDDSESCSRTSKLQMLARVAFCLSSPDLSDAAFIALTIRFRRLICACLSKHRPLTGRAPFRSNSVRDIDQVEGVLSFVREELSFGRLPELVTVAQSLAMEIEDIRRLLANQLGCNYRQCRRALRIRASISAVAFTAEQHAQIAYTLGYEHATQFTRDFHETLGLAPHDFRALASGDQVI